MSLKFSIQAWNAWDAARHAQPDVSVIPPLLRRRLSTMGRAALSVAIPLAAEHGAMPLVFVSRHGEINRTLSLLESIAEDEQLSPTVFSLSVHNAIAGLFSIQQGLTSNISAIAATSEDLLPGLLEAIGMCSPKTPEVLCVFCDDPLPAFYRPYVAEPTSGFAVALVLSYPSSPNNNWTLTHQQTAATVNNEPQALQLLAMLESAAPELLIASNGSQWKLERVQQ